LDSDFVIIGAGALGLACAEYLCRQGVEVTIVDKGRCGNEASWAGGGILSTLCPWDYPEEVTRLAARGAAMFGDWAGELRAATGIDPEYERSGMLVLPPFDLARAEAWCAAHGLPAEIDRKQDSLLLPDVAQVRNPRLLRALRARVESLGGRIVEHCEVTRVAVRDGQVASLETDCGEFSASSYILTAGAWSRAVLGEHALQMDINPVRGQMLLFKFAVPPVAHILLQGDLYLIPRRDGHLLVGSTMEHAGFDKSTTPEARDSLWQRAQAILPELAAMPLVRQWAGLRPGSPGNIPFIGWHPSLSNLYINSGHFRYGVTMAQASVEIMANDLAGSPQAIDATPYRAERILKLGNLREERGVTD
jgi:glycine oxidase